MPLLGKVSEFDQEKDTWVSYEERLDQYFIANDIDDNDKKRAVLISTVGSESYHLLRNLCVPQTPKQKTYDDLVKLLKNHYQPKPSVIVQRFKFNNRFRTPPESVSNFVAELRRLSFYCDYGDKLEEMLRDRIVAGINDREIQEKLLQKPDLTFEIAFKLAKEVELARVNSQQLSSNLNAALGNSSSSTPQAEPDSVHRFSGKGRSVKSSFDKDKKFSDQKSQQNFEEKKCFRCLGNHHPDSCRFKTEQCRFCRKVGHIVRTCRAREQKEAKDKLKSKNFCLSEDTGDEESYHFEASGNSCDFNLF